MSLTEGLCDIKLASLYDLKLPSELMEGDVIIVGVAKRIAKIEHLYEESAILVTFDGGSFCRLRHYTEVFVI